MIGARDDPEAVALVEAGGGEDELLDLPILRRARDRGDCQRSNQRDQRQHERDEPRQREP
jgi:hypothetical protein